MTSTGTQKRATAKAKEGAAQAEVFIDKAVETAKRRSKSEGWPCTAEDIINERDTRGLSWKQVAVNLKLGSPGQARKAYTELTGKPHDTSTPIVNRAPRGSGVGTGQVLTPLWDDESDQDEIIERVQGPWVPEARQGKDIIPGHFRGSTITVRRQVRGGPVWEETMRVMRIDRFAYDGKDEDGPLVVHVSTETGWRCFRVAEIVAVR